MERLVGLTEMFPSFVRNAVCTGAETMVSGSFFLWSISKTGLWVVASSASILALPIMFERERSQMEEMQLQQQRQVKASILL